MRLLQTTQRYETNKKAVDQTDLKNITGIFRVHLLRWCDLIKRS
jgi:hypothetical protein